MRQILLASLLSLAFTAVPMTAGQSSDTVRAAQQALKDKGFDPGPVDGINGPQTQAAVKSFQEKQNLDADGHLGPKTLDSLGLKEARPGKEFGAAGENVKNSYGEGGKEVGHGSKQMGSDVKHGEVVDGAKSFGKGVGEGAKDIGVGTAHAAKNAAKGVKNAVTPGKKDTNPQ